MKTTLMSRNGLKNTCYILLLFCASLSVSAQCPTVNPTPPAICNDPGVTFNDLRNPPYSFVTDGGDGIVWYKDLIGGIALNVTSYVPEGTYYIDNSSGSCSPRLPIFIDFVVDPTGQNLDDNYCSNENATIQTYIDDVLQPNIPSGGSVEVYYNNDLINQADPTNVFPNALTNLAVVFVDGSCRSQFESARVGGFASPQDPTPQDPQAFCSSSNPTVGDLDPGTPATNFNWYQASDASGGALLPSDALINNNTYYIRIEDGGCTSNLIPVTVTIDTPIDAGSSDTLQYCEDNISPAVFNLFDELGGFPQITGSWTGPLTITNGHLGTVNISTLIAGTHVFTYTIPTGGVCPPGISTISIIISEPLTSGMPSTVNSATFCESGLPSNFDLTTLLENEDPNGLWTQGILSTDPPVTLPIDLSTGAFTLGTYNFTYWQNLLTPCTDDSTTVQVVVLADPNAGTALNAIFCENELGTNSPYDLFNALDGSQDIIGGTWTDATNTTVTNPIDITGLTTAGSPYTFNYTIDNGTCSDTEPITITVRPAPESGTPIATFPEFCEGTVQTVALFDLLTGEDQTGTWSDDDASGVLFVNEVTIGSLMAGTYNFTFDVDAIGTCDDTNVTVSIIINDTASPTATATQEFCDTARVTDLAATGTTILWYDDATGGAPLVGTIDLIHGETYYATQTDATTGCESSVRTLVTVAIYVTPNSGGLATSGISECNNTTIDLNSGLDGTQDNTGTWYEGLDNTGTIIASPTTYDVTGFTAGNYQFTYYVTASLPCVDASITITINVDEPLSAGISNGDRTFCSSDGIFNLDSNLTGASSGGEWTFNSTPVSNQFDPSSGQSGTYTYTISNTCGSSSESFDMTVTQAPNAGTSGPALICVIDGPTDLFDSLGVADVGGTWSPALTSNTGVFDPLVDTSGIYTYTVTANSPCVTNAIADITVTVSDITPPIVNNATMVFCLADNPTVANLDAALTVTGTITWYEDAILTTPLNAIDTLVDGEDYYATQTNSSGCESSISVQVDVIVNDTATPILDNPAAEYCVNDDPTIHDLTLNITEYNALTDNIIWYDAATNGTAISDSTILNHDVTYYAVLVDAITGCESSVRLAVTTDLTSCGKLIIPDGFSPNGDGTNDTFNIDHLGVLYPNFVIEIFNRYGNMVYKGNDHAPRFDGTSNQSRTIGSGDLPVGVYFYIFYFNDSENKPEQGRLYLSR